MSNEGVVSSLGFFKNDSQISEGPNCIRKKVPSWWLPLELGMQEHTPVADPEIRREATNMLSLMLLQILQSSRSLDKSRWNTWAEQACLSFYLLA